MKQTINIALALTLAWLGQTAFAQDAPAPVTGSETAEVAATTDAMVLEDPTVVALWNADRTTIFEAGDIVLEDLQWIARPLVIFADGANDPRLRQQLDLLATRPEDLAERDVIVIVDSDPEAMSPLRTTLRPRDFMVALLAKDGRVAQRKPSPVQVRELARAIDKMPLRQQEIEDSRLLRE